MSTTSEVAEPAPRESAKPRRRRAPSLRTRVTVAAALVTVVLVLLVGAVAWTQVTDSGYRELDARVDTLSAASQPSLSNPNAATVASNVASGSLATVRLGSVVVASTPTPIPQRDNGIGDMTVQGTPFRVKTVSVLDSSLLNGLASVSVAVPLQPTLDDIASAHRVLLAIGFGAVVASAILAWLLGGVAVRPLRRLARHTAAMPVDADPSSAERIALQSIRGAREAEELATAMDSLLRRVDAEHARTQDALATARDFASVSAHELRTPLTAMRTDLEVLDTFAPDEAARREIVGDLRRAHARVQETLSALESLAQGELGGRRSERLDVVDVLDRVVTEARTMYPDIRIDLTGAQSLWAPVIEAGLRMAVENAIRNAVRHGRASRVVVGVEPQDDGLVSITVDDDGGGVRPADRERVFGRFERGSSARAGSGLGLALIAQQAALHGGSAHLDDSPLGGARLCILIRGAITREATSRAARSRG